MSTITNKTATTATDATKPTIVAGQEAQSVSVQSQLASSTVGGEVQSKSNLHTIVGDLQAAHNAHAGWLESETAKITQWGSSEIARLMEQTKAIETRLVGEAQAKQKALDETHKAELARVVQELDAKKAMQLKELEDGLQRQIQAALNTTKADINNIESEMNKRKMALMQQAQEQTAKDVSRLSNLSVEAKLVPSTTRTIIETNTNTGTVVAVAGGGEIKTGAAQASVIATEKVQAAPMAGTLTQQSDVTLGDIRRDSDNAKVGDGVIVNTITGVTQHTNEQPVTGAQPAPVAAGGAPVNAGVTIHQDAADKSLPAAAGEKKIDAAYGRPAGKTMLGVGGHGLHPQYNKNVSERAQLENADSKAKSVLGVGEGTEPRSTDAHNTKL